MTRYANDLGEGFGRFVALTTLGALLPGLGLIAAGCRRAGAAVLLTMTLLLGVAGCLLISGEGKSLAINTAVDPGSLVIIAVASIAVGLAWCSVIVATSVAARARRPTRLQRGLGALLTLSLCLLVAAPATMAARYSLITRDLINSVFSSSSTVKAIPGAATPRPGAADPWAAAPRVNLLLLGSDAGSDRIGLRADSVIVASIDTKTGNTVLLGLPRNLENVPFGKDPLSKVWPNGFNCGSLCVLFAVWRQAEAHRDLFPHDTQPGLTATRDVVNNVLGIKIDYYAIINLAGFQGLVNAMDGVYVNVATKLPIGGSHGATGNVTSYPTGYITPGRHKRLSGYQALWYARSRFSSDDYDRMRRQRCMVGALVAQTNPIKLLKQYPQIARVAKNNIATDLPRQDLPAWVTLVQRMQHGKITSLPFTSSLVNTSNPDFTRIRVLAERAIRTSHVSTTPSTTSPDSLTPTASAPGTPASRSQNIADVC